MTAEIVQFPKLHENRANIEKRIRAVLDVHGDDICGFGLVVWGSKGSSTADLGTKQPDQGAIIPEILIPDFIRNRLLAVKIEDWTVDTVRGFIPSQDDPA